MISLRGMGATLRGGAGGAWNCPGLRGPGAGRANSIPDCATLMVQTLCVA